MNPAPVLVNKSGCVNEPVCEPELGCVRGDGVSNHPVIEETNEDNITFAERLDCLKKKKKKKKEELKVNPEEVSKEDTPSPILFGRSGRIYCDCEDPSCEGFCKSWYVLNRKVLRDQFEGVNLCSRRNVASTSGSLNLVDHDDDLDYGDAIQNLFIAGKVENKIGIAGSTKLNMTNEAFAAFDSMMICLAKSEPATVNPINSSDIPHPPVKNKKQQKRKEKVVHGAEKAKFGVFIKDI